MREIKTIEQYRERMIEAFHNAGYDELIAYVVLPFEEEFITLEKILKSWKKHSFYPSAEPKKGKWIDFSNEGYVECPYCHSATNCDGNKEELHYCYSCGADLRKE